MPSDVRSILTLEVPLIVLLGERKARVAEVTALVPGAIVEVPKHAEEELQILINNKVIGTGVAVKVGENFGVRITYIGDIKDRIQALANAEKSESDPAPQPELVEQAA